MKQLRYTLLIMLVALVLLRPVWELPKRKKFEDTGCLYPLREKEECHYGGAFQ